MIKLMILAKRADNVSLEKLKSWWLGHHAGYIARLQAPYLKRYVINVRTAISGPRVARQGALDSEPNWDGCAELWFETWEDLNAAFAAIPEPRPADMREHFGAVQFLAVEEHEIPPFSLGSANAILARWT